MSVLPAQEASMAQISTAASQAQNADHSKISQVDSLQPPIDRIWLLLQLHQDGASPS